jgi:hypothetical protein
VKRLPSTAISYQSTIYSGDASASSVSRHEPDYEGVVLRRGKIPRAVFLEKMQTSIPVE